MEHQALFDDYIDLLGHIETLEEILRAHKKRRNELNEAICVVLSDEPVMHRHANGALYELRKRRGVSAPYIVDARTRSE